MDSNTLANRLLAAAAALGVVGTALCLLDGPAVTTQHNIMVTNNGFVTTVGSTGAYQPLTVQANKRIPNKSTVILDRPVDNLGKAGEVVEVSTGYFQNFLKPTKMASVATAEKLAEIRLAQEQAEAEAEAELAAARKMAGSFQTLAKFTIKKEADEEDKIYGSVTAQEVADIIDNLMGKKINKKNFMVPEITKLGTYPVEVVLHPKVVGKFNVVVVKGK